MKENFQKSVLALAAHLVVLGVTLTFPHHCVAAQNTGAGTSNSRITADKSYPTDDENQRVNPIAEEMRIKREIRFAEKEHRQKLDRAKEASDLGQELAASFRRKNWLDREDFKKLDRLEKLAKRLRTEAGGSDDEVTLDHRPNDLAEAVGRIADVSASLNDRVQETPRQVISAKIIDNANVLLELIQLVRGFPSKPR